MSMRRDPDRVIATWLADEARAGAPDRLLSVTRTRLESTHQRRSWWPAWRIDTMTTSAKVVIAAAVAVVVAVGAMTLLPRSSPQIATNGPSAVPSAVTSPATTPSSSPSPTALPSPTMAGRSLRAVATGAVLDPGTYYAADPFPVPFSISLAKPWTRDDVALGHVMIHKVGDGTSNDGAPAWLMVDLVDNVYPNPCFPDKGLMDPPVANTVDGIVNALTHLPKSSDPGHPLKLGRFYSGAVTDVIIDGHPGKTFTLKNSVLTADNKCTDDPWLPLWRRRSDSADYATIFGATNQIWAVDVDGTTVVIHAETFDWTSDANLAEIGPAVESIRFGP